MPRMPSTLDDKSRKLLLTSSHTEQHPKDFAEQGPEPDNSWHLHTIQIALDLRDSRTCCHWLLGRKHTNKWKTDSAAYTQQARKLSRDTHCLLSQHPLPEDLFNHRWRTSAWPLTQHSNKLLQVVWPHGTFQYHCRTTPQILIYIPVNRFPGDSKVVKTKSTFPIHTFLINLTKHHRLYF